MNLAARIVCPVAAVIVATGCATSTPTAAPPSTDGPRPAASAQSPRTGTTAKPVLAAPVPGAPVRVRVPALGVDAPVLPVKAPDGTLVPPADPSRLGWWAAGARPGERSGSVLIAGHTTSSGGPGALNDLETVRRGDRVEVGTRRGRVTYRVVSVRVLGKGRLAQRAEKLFDQGVANRLVLVTCEDWDGTRYLSNVVVTATPTT